MMPTFRSRRENSIGRGEAGHHGIESIAKLWEPKNSGGRVGIEQKHFLLKKEYARKIRIEIGLVK